MNASKTTLDQYDRIIDTMRAIPLDGSISVLTGRNGSGKSLIRQQLNFRTKAKNGKPVVHCSMELRTKLHDGGMGIFFRDIEWQPTSMNTLHFIECASNSVREGFLVLDEIEVGCGEETVVAIVDWLNENLRKRIEGSLGCLVITHSRQVVKNLNFDHWFNLDGYDTATEWMKRKIVPVDLEQFKADSMELFRYITSQMKGNDR